MGDDVNRHLRELAIEACSQMDDTGEDAAVFACMCSAAEAPSKLNEFLSANRVRAWRQLPEWDEGAHDDGCLRLRAILMGDGH